MKLSNKTLFLLLSAVVVISFTFLFIGCEAPNEANGNEANEAVNANGEVPWSEFKGTYQDGRYRGTYQDRGDEQVGIQFHLEDNVITDISFRMLYYAGNDYLDPENEENEWPVEDLEVLEEQYNDLIEYLIGKEITEIGDLYTPELAAADADGTGEILDTWTGATLRGNKLISAIRDGLNRGIY